MNTELPDTPTDLIIDMDQWRRDIQTFAQTTQQALDAIVAELSNHCSGGFSSDPNHRLGDPAIPSFENQFSGSPSSVPVSADEDGNDRLEKLKLKLAARISKSNPTC